VVKGAISDLVILKRLAGSPAEALTGVSFTFRRHFYPMLLTVGTFVRRKIKNNMSLWVQ
jgi:hypothetical protein